MSKKSLRQRAEALLAKDTVREIDATSAKQLIHELAVHQVELEMQNEELREARNEALAARESYRLLFELAPCGYVVLDESGIVLDANMAAIAILDERAERILNRPIMMRVHPKDHTLFFGTLAYAFKTEGVKTAELRFSLEGDSEKWVRFQCRATISPKVRTRCLCTMEDITLSREKEAAEESARNASLKISELEADNKWLRKIDLVKSEFVSSVSHEFRTPLTSILGFTKLIHKDLAKSSLLSDVAPGRKKGVNHRVLNNLEIVMAESKRLAKLVNDLLDLSKIESGFMGWSDTETSLRESVSRTIVSLKGLFSNNSDISISFDVPEDLPSVFIDPQRLDQVCVNLLSNAFKHTEKGTIMVSACSVTPGFVTLQVRDSGVGIERARLLRIFDSFYQGDSSVQGSELHSTGLGLAICRKIIDHYGGEIWAESTVGQGTVVTVELPIA